MSTENVDAGRSPWTEEGGPRPSYCRSGAACMHPECTCEPRVPGDVSLESLSRHDVRDEASAARRYLINNLLQPLAPQITPMDTLLGVCTQVDSVTASLRAKPHECKLLRDWAAIAKGLNLSVRSEDVADFDDELASLLAETARATIAWRDDRLHEVANSAVQQIKAAEEARRAETVSLAEHIAEDMRRPYVAAGDRNPSSPADSQSANGNTQRAPQGINR